MLFDLPLPLAGEGQGGGAGPDKAFAQDALMLAILFASFLLLLHVAAQAVFIERLATKAPIRLDTRMAARR